MRSEEEGKIVDVRRELKEKEEKENFWRVCHMLEVFSENEVDLKINNNNRTKWKLKHLKKIKHEYET